MKERDVVLVYGKTGMGKSRWTKRYLRSLRRVIVLDPMLEHEGELVENADRLVDHTEPYPTFRVRTDALDESEMIARLAMALNAPKRWGADPAQPDSRSKIPELTLAIEESQLVLPSGAQKMSPAFAHIIYRGRHHRVSPVFISQRPSTVHIAARSQWTRLIVFYQTEGSDTKWLEEQTGIDGSEFSALRPGEYFDVNPFGWEKLILPDQRATLYPVHRNHAPREEAM